MNYLIIAIEQNTESVLYPSNESEYRSNVDDYTRNRRYTMVKEYITPADDRLSEYTIGIMQKLSRKVKCQS